MIYRTEAAKSLFQWNAGSLLFETLRKNSNEICIKIQFSSKNEFKNVVCKMAAILSQLRCVNKRWTIRTIIWTFNKIICLQNQKFNADFVIFQNSESAQKYPSTVWGASWDGDDLTANHVMLPEVGLGDSLVFPDMGAYTLACASGFNGLRHPVSRYYRHGEELFE